MRAQPGSAAAAVAAEPARAVAEGGDAAFAPVPEADDRMPFAALCADDVAAACCILCFGRAARPQVDHSAHRSAVLRSAGRHIHRPGCHGQVQSRFDGKPSVLVAHAQLRAMNGRAENGRPLNRALKLDLRAPFTGRPLSAGRFIVQRHRD